MDDVRVDKILEYVEGRQTTEKDMVKKIDELHKSVDNTHTCMKLVQKDIKINMAQSNKHELFINGSAESVGAKSKIALLEEAQKTQKRNTLVVITSFLSLSVALIGKAVWSFFTGKG